MGDRIQAVQEERRCWILCLAGGRPVSWICYWRFASGVENGSIFPPFSHLLQLLLDRLLCIFALTFDCDGAPLIFFAAPLHWQDTNSHSRSLLPPAPRIWLSLCYLQDASTKPKHPVRAWGSLRCPEFLCIKAWHLSSYKQFKKFYYFEFL